MVGGVVVQPGSELDGMRIRELSTQTRVIAIARGDRPPELYPHLDTRFEASETAYLVGPYHELLSTLRKGQSGHPRRAHPPLSIAEGLGLSDPF